MAKKFDMSKVKGLLMEKGERLALVGVVAVVALILFLGILGPMAPNTSPPAGAGESAWSAVINKQVQAMENNIKSSQPGPKDIPAAKQPVDYPRLYAGAVALLAPRTGLGQTLAAVVRVHSMGQGATSGDYIIFNDPQFAANFGPFIEPLIDARDERINPIILPIGTNVTEDLREIQVDYFPAPALSYEVNFGRREYMAVVGKDGKVLHPAVLMEPRRMVVVSMTVPIKEQLEEFRRALRYPTVNQLVQKGEAPLYLGLNIFRSQLGQDGKESQPVPLYRYDAKEKKTVIGLGMPGDDKFSDALETFYRKMKIDTHNPELLTDFIGPNMVTPLPEVATVTGKPGAYPSLKLTGLPKTPEEEMEAKPAKEDNPANPFGKLLKQPTDKKTGGTKQNKESGGSIQPHPWKELSVELQYRLRGNYNVFDPMAAPLKKEKDLKEKLDKKMNAVETTAPRKLPKPKQVEGEGDAQELTRLLARFIDIEAEVGKTYRYYIQVRVANPNFEKGEEVSHMELTKIPELNSGWATTPWITVPSETFFYAVDQKSYSDGLETKEAKEGNDKDKLDPEKTTVQIHRWIGQTGEAGEDRLIGDWVVAERLVIRRGEPIGRKRVLVEVPEWMPTKGRFELGFHGGGKGKAAAKSTGVPIDFIIGNPPPILVDFQGGKHDKYKIGRFPAKDDAAVEMLVLTSDGKLTVRNSRIDGDPETEPGRERLAHYRRWRTRVQNVRESTSGTNTKNAFPTK